MRLEQLLDSPWLGKALMWAGASVLASACLMLFLPGLIDVADDDAISRVVVESIKVSMVFYEVVAGLKVTIICWPII